MDEKDKPKEKEKKQPTVEDVRKSLKNDLGFLRDVTNYVKQMTDNGCINPTLATDIKNMVEMQLRQVLSLPEKPTPPPYVPPAPTQQMPGQAPPVPPYPPR